MGAALPFAGGIGQLLGGNSSSDGTTNSTSTGTSANQAQNSNVQAAQSTSSNNASNRSGSGNQSYGALNSALNPTLGYVSSAGDMIGSLLGLAPSHTVYSGPTSSVLPPEAAPAAAAPLPAGITITPDMISQLYQSYVSSLPPAASTPTSPTPTPTPTPTPIPTPTPSPTPSPSSSPYGTLPNGQPNLGASGNIARDRSLNMADHRAAGGPVSAGQPYIVGENRPELFVPHTDGHIVPQVPGGANNMFPTNSGAAGVGTPIAAGMDGMSGQHGMKMRDLIGRHGGPPPIATPGPVPVPPVGGVPVINHPPVGTPGTAANGAGSALNTFANSAGQQFILNEGQKALSGASAANGTFDSGATGKALTQYGQNLGSTYLNDYMNNLFNYAKLGLGSASALSGAGGATQGVGSSAGGSNSASIGYGSGTSTGNSSTGSVANGTTSSSAKQGLGI